MAYVINKNSKLLNYNYLRTLPLVMFFVGLLFSCSTTYNTINNRNFIDKYNPNSKQMHPAFAVFMKSANEYRLHFRIFPEELTYIKPDSTQAPQANISISYRITRNYNSVQIIDSLTRNYELKANPKQQFLGFMPIHFPDTGRYVIEAFLTDINAAQTANKVIDVNINKAGNENSFFIISKLASLIFKPYISVNDTFNVRSEMFFNKGLKISYFKAETQTPQLPYLINDTVFSSCKADSTISLSTQTIDNISTDKEGFIILTDVDNKAHRTIGVFNKHYPYVKTPVQLLRSLTYLCTPQEMDEYQKETNTKHAIDSFWVAAGGNMQNAKELIRVYYNRVQLANYYFSDYREGWLTDRGMIYIIFGAPQVTKLTDNSEYWVYRKEKYSKFFFSKEKHTTFGTIYKLQRNNLYHRIWQNAIDSWRNGKIFSLNY